MRFQWILMCILLATVGQAQVTDSEVWSSSFTYMGSVDVDSRLQELGISRLLPQIRKTKVAREVENFKEKIAIPIVNKDALPLGQDPLRQELLRTDFNLSPVLSIEGPQFNSSNPPDPCGAMGKDYYISMINSSMGAEIWIYDRLGNLAVSPLFGDELFWSQLGINGRGDPIVLYDQEAERWLLTEFADIGEDMMLLAFSETSDPFGSWDLYVIDAPSFPDYPKYGMWHNAYFVTTNEIDPNVPVYFIDRQALIAREPAPRILRSGIPKFDVPFGTSFFQVASPVDWIGTNKPDSSDPVMLVRMRDDAWGVGGDAIELWSFSIDWTGEGTVVVDGPTSIGLSPFDSDLCAGALFDCIQNPNGQTQSALAQVIMHRPVYRKFDTHESIVLNFSVDVDNTRNISGIRWVELRRQEEDWELYQEGTFSPDDDHRYMGSTSINANGDILLAYSVLGPSTFNGLRYTGRRADDPLGVMTLTEGSIVEGMNNNDGARWGDYSSMTVDPEDENGFWYIGEYMTEGLGVWGNKIAHFVIPSDSSDITPVFLSSPSLLDDLTSPNELRVAIQNIGETTPDSFLITAIAEGLDTFSLWSLDPLLPSTIQEYTLASDIQIDIDSPGLHFDIFVEWFDDENSSNDTLRADRLNLSSLPLDLTRSSLGLIPCIDLDESLNLTVSLSNPSVITVESFEIISILNSTFRDTMEFNTIIDPLGSREVEIPLQNLLQGVNTLELITTNVNERGYIDRLTDTLVTEFTIDTTSAEINFELLPDDFPQEVSWQLLNEQGDIVWDGALGFGVTGLQEFNPCVPLGCYSFVMTDAAGDGICCQYGLGSYRLTDSEGNILAEGGEYGLEDITDFCLPVECRLAAELTVTNGTEGLSDGIIFVLAEMGQAPYEYSIDGGPPQASGLFDNLVGNQSYDITITDANGCQFDSTVFVGLVTSAQQVSPEQEFALFPNPSDGEFVLEWYGNTSDMRVQYEIYSALGVLVQEDYLYRWNDVLVDRVRIENAQPGMYFVRISDDSGSSLFSFQVH